MICDGHKNISVKSSWTLIGLLDAQHWSSVYTVRVRISRDTTGVSSSISQQLQVYASEDQLSAYLVGFLDISVQSSAVSSSNQRVNNLKFAIKRSFIRYHSFGSHSLLG